MRPVRANITIDRPAAEVYRYLSDIASRPEFAPRVFLDFRLARIESRGFGAGARYRLHPKLRDRYAGSTIVQAVPNELILEEGSTGRNGRVPLVIEYLIDPVPGGATKVQIGIETHPLNPVDTLREFGLRRRIRSRLPRAVRRLRDILEGSAHAEQGQRPTVGGMDASYISNP